MMKRRVDPPSRERDLGDFHRHRVDLEEAAARIARHPHGAVGRDPHVIGLRLRVRRADDLEVAGLRIEAADQVRRLEAEEQDAVLVEGERVRIRLRIRHLVDGGLAGRRIDHADGAVLVARVPGPAFVIELHGVRHRTGRQLVFPGLAGARIKPPDQVAVLPGVPDRTVGMLHRIAHARTELRHHPFLEGDVEIARHHRGLAPIVGREILREVVDDRVLRIRRRRQVDHGGDQLLPVIAGIAGAGVDQAGDMTAGADGRDLILARTVGKRRRPLGLALRLRGERNERECGGSDQRCGQRSRHFPPSDGLLQLAHALSRPCWVSSKKREYSGL